MPLPRVLICDVDGTICSTSHRNPYDTRNCHLDPPNADVIWFLNHILATTRIHVIFCSGRKEMAREKTVQFLDKHVKRKFPFFRKWTALYMRGDRDGRDDRIVKGEMHEKYIKGKYDVICALDDRDRVVQCWRDLGIFTWQVRPGAF